MASKSPKQALVVYNPQSGTAHDLDARLGAIVRRLCENSSYVANVRPLKPGLTPQDLLAPMLGPFELVIAAGGDGTVGAVLGAVAEAAPNVPVGIVPFGTGNLLARTFGIVPEHFRGDILEYAMDIILSGEPQPIDLGRMNGSWFAIDAGAGPIADAITIPGTAEKRTWKMFAYTVPLLKSMTRPPLVFKISTDLEPPVVVSASGLFITNSHEMGIGSRNDITQVQDGLLDLCVLSPLTPRDYWRMTMRFAYWFFLKKLYGNPPYLIKRFRKAHIELVDEKPKESAFHRFSRAFYSFLTGKFIPSKKRVLNTPTMVEGDRRGRMPMDVEVVPHAVRVIVPKPPVTPEQALPSSAEPGALPRATE
jgi:diacylglycerol kinase (ATP)